MGASDNGRTQGGATTTRESGTAGCEGNAAGHPVPTVSVLIPIYNVERYLEACLSSLAAQTFGDFEAICLNDGSTDSSPAIARAFAERDARFRVVDKPNSGYGATMNVGLHEARGTYIAVLESDDLMYPDALRILVGAARTSDAQAVKGNFTFYWSADDGRDVLHRMIDTDMARDVVDTRSDMRIFYQKASIWSGLYRRDFIERNDLRFLETPGASYQDTSFAFKVWACCERARFVCDPIVHYRQDNESSSVNSKGKVYCVCTEYAEIDSWLRARPRDEFSHGLERMAQISKLNAYLWNLDRLGAEFKLEFAERIKQEFDDYDRAGKLHLDEWDAWKAMNVEALRTDPAKYVAVRSKSSDESRMGKALFALRLGGPAALVRAVRSTVAR